MVFDGGLITIPLAAAIATIVATTAGGVATGCYMSTGSLTCQGNARPQPLFPDCAGPNTTDQVTARWAVVDTTNTESTVTVTTGVDRTQDWARSVNAITSSSWSAFTLDLIGGVAWMLGSPSPDGPHPRSSGNAYSTTYELLRQERDTLAIDCPAGVVWQWQLSVQRCAEQPEATTVGTRHLRCTVSRATPPCCIPGWDTDPTEPAEGCLTHHAADGRDVSMRLGGEYCQAFRDVKSKVALRSEPPARSAGGERAAAVLGAPLLGGIAGLALGTLVAPGILRRAVHRPSAAATPALV